MTDKALWTPVELGSIHLPHRLATFYGGDHGGYTNYPVLAA